MNNFKAGFSRVDITPMLGIRISGYYQTRIADGVLDELEANAIALEVNGKRAVIVSLDLVSIRNQAAVKLKESVMNATRLQNGLIGG